MQDWIAKILIFTTFVVPVYMALNAKKPGTTKPIPAKRKKIVIVGSSFGGRTLVQKL